LDIDIQDLMLLFFIALFIISVWKIYAFLPNEQLKDDDHTKESIKELESLMLDSIKSLHVKNIPLKNSNIYNEIVSNKNFDKKHYWRFNQNRLNHLLNEYMFKNKISSIEEIIIAR
jgi:hypothetical protein